MNASNPWFGQYPSDAYCSTWSASRGGNTQQRAFVHPKGKARDNRERQPQQLTMHCASLQDLSQMSHLIGHVVIGHLEALGMSSKLNPEAKVFTPRLNPYAKVFTPKMCNSMGNHMFNHSNKNAWSSKSTNVGGSSSGDKCCGKNGSVGGGQRTNLGDSEPPVADVEVESNAEAFCRAAENAKTKNDNGGFSKDIAKGSISGERPSNSFGHVNGLCLAKCDDDETNERDVRSKSEQKKEGINENSLKHKDEARSKASSSILGDRSGRHRSLSSCSSEGSFIEFCSEDSSDPATPKRAHFELSSSSSSSSLSSSSDEEDEDGDEEEWDEIDGPHQFDFDDIPEEFKTPGLLVEDGRVTCNNAIRDPMVSSLKQRVAEANARWNRNTAKELCPQVTGCDGLRRVKFSCPGTWAIFHEDPGLAESLREARISDFTQRMADKERFEALLAPIFDRKHRSRVFRDRFSQDD